MTTRHHQICCKLSDRWASASQVGYQTVVGRTSEWRFRRQAPCHAYAPFILPWRELREYVTFGFGDHHRRHGGWADGFWAGTGHHRSPANVPGSDRRRLCVAGALRHQSAVRPTRIAVRSGASCAIDPTIKVDNPGCFNEFSARTHGTQRGGRLSPAGGYDAQPWEIRPRRSAPAAKGRHL